MLPTVSAFLRQSLGMPADQPLDDGAPAMQDSWTYDERPTVPQTFTPPPEPAPDIQITAGGPPTPGGQWEPWEVVPNPQQPQPVPPTQWLAEDSVSTPVQVAEPTTPPPSPYQPEQEASMRPREDRFETPEPTATQQALQPVWDAAGNVVGYIQARGGRLLEQIADPKPIVGQSEVDRRLLESARTVGRPAQAAVEGTARTVETAMGAPEGSMRQAAEDVSNVLGPGGPMLGIVRRGGGAADDAGRAAHRTVEVLQDKIADTRRVLADIDPDLEPELFQQVQDRMARLTSQLVDAQNARLNLEPAIASDVGRRVNPLTMSEEGADTLTDAMRPRERVSPEDAASLGGPASVPTPYTPSRLNALPFDPSGAAAGGAVGSMTEGEDGEAGDPWRTALGIAVGGILGRKAMSATERDAWARAIKQAAARGQSDELLQQARLFAQQTELPGFGAIDELTDPVRPPAARTPPTLGQVAARARAENLPGPTVAELADQGATGTRVPAGQGELPGMPAADPLRAGSHVLPDAERTLQETAPRALNWYQRKAAENARRITQSGREPLNPRQWLMSLAGNVGYSSMLGPGTFSVNLAVGAGEPIWSIPKEFLRQGARAVQTRNLSALREHGEMQWGALYGMSRMGEAVLGALRGRGRYAPNPNFPTLSQQTVNPIGQLVAQAIEAPGRVWSSLPDAIFGTIAQHAGEAREAAQIATNKGLTGAAWKQEVSRLLQDARAVAAGQLPTGPEVQQVVDAGAAYASRQTYRDELGTIGKQVEKVAKLGNAPVLGTWATPFYKTIWTAGVRQAEKTPLGLAMDSQPTRFDKAYDALIGGAVVLGMGNYAASGGVTGSGPADSKERELLREQGWQPYSTYVKLPGMEGVYVPNRMFGIFESVLNTVGETHDAFAYQKPDADARAKFDDAMRRTGQLIRQNPYAFQGLVSVLDAYNTGLIASASEQAARMTPFGSAARTIGQMTDTMERTTDRGRGIDPADEFVQRWQQQTGQRSGLPVAQDAFGQPRENQRRGVMALWPSMPRIKDAPEARIFREARVMPGNPPAEVRVTRSSAIPPMPLTPAERRLWDQKRGEVLLGAGRTLAADPEWASAPLEVKQKTLRRIMDMAADAANGQVLDAIGDDEITRRIDAAIERQQQQQAS